MIRFVVRLAVISMALTQLTGCLATLAAAGVGTLVSAESSSRGGDDAVSAERQMRANSELSRICKYGAQERRHTDVRKRASSGGRYDPRTGRPEPASQEQVVNAEGKVVCNPPPR